MHDFKHGDLVLTPDNTAAFVQETIGQHVIVSDADDNYVFHADKLSPAKLILADDAAADNIPISAVDLARLRPGHPVTLLPGARCVWDNWACPVLAQLVGDTLFYQSGPDVDGDIEVSQTHHPDSRTFFVSPTYVKAGA